MKSKCTKTSRTNDILNRHPNDIEEENLNRLCWYNFYTKLLILSLTSWFKKILTISKLPSFGICTSQILQLTEYVEECYENKEITGHEDYASGLVLEFQIQKVGARFQRTYWFKTNFLIFIFLKYCWFMKRIWGSTSSVWEFMSRTLSQW